MIVARSTAASAAALVLVALSACGPKHVQSIPGQTIVALLPDPEDGKVGAAVATNSSGSVDLTSARASTTVAPNQPPAAVVVLTEADVNRLFGDALSALPAAPQHFILYFRFESNELTDESHALLPKVLDAVRQQPFPDVSVIGHTDTTGTNSGNYQLGLRRANTIRDRLIESGISASLIEATSHGEADPLIKTADEVLEPRNRRVEITVR
ncbi:MAG TPA: OmpA family protein [Vicinamibacterales bacterium]|jgi:outer membrane protein OmpA-like peptidoglycan-associated protein